MFFPDYFIWPCFLPTAAAAKSLQSCPTLCDPTDGSPPASPVHRILYARILEWVAISCSFFFLLAQLIEENKKQKPPS